MKWLSALLPGILLLTPVFPAVAKTGDDLTEADRQQLARDKILMGSAEYRQSFEPYINNDLPVFITSDAVLNAFHVLFEESLARLEAANLPKLESLLSRMIEALPKAVGELQGVPQFKDGAVRRAEIMLKTAQRLLAHPAQGSTPEIEAIIATQVAEIEAATGMRKPAWLGPPDEGFPALDFSRYQPRGFYTGATPLQRYFRAVAWLQSVPFRVKRGEEYLAAKLIGRAGYLSQPEAHWTAGGGEPFLDAFTELLGPGDDCSLANLIENARGGDSLVFSAEDTIEESQTSEIESLQKSHFQQVNDTLRFPKDDPFAEGVPTPSHQIIPPWNAQAPVDPEYRILSAVALPDAVMLQRTTQPQEGLPTRYPDSLEVAAGMGSKWAAATLASQIPAATWAGIAPAVQWLAARKKDKSLYGEYLEVLRELVNAPEPDAPDFLRSEPWQRKSSQTLLSSWGLMRHALVLQAKTNAHWGAGTDLPPGFVEPDPEFFRRLGELTTRCLTVLADAGAFSENTQAVILDELHRGLAQAEAMEKAGAAIRETWWGPDLENACRRIISVAEMPGEPEYPERGDNVTDAAWEKLETAYHKQETIHSGKLRVILAGIIQNLETSDSNTRNEMLAKMHVPAGPSMATRWRGLSEICSQAQSISHRQLRKIPLTKEEEDFIKEFGVKLARAMFYDGNSYVSPRDNAPRVVDVFSGAEGHLHAGIGRPRAFYVLYPWQGKEVLCVGSVLPFYEFKHGPDRLTDAAWLGRLDNSPPDPPAWLKSIMGTPPVAKAPEK